MKLIGTKPDGGVVLECGPKEFFILKRLDEVMNGKLLDDIYTFNQSATYFDLDITVPFEAIYLWIKQKDKANQLRTLANQVESAMGLQKGKDNDHI